MHQRCKKFFILANFSTKKANNFSPSLFSAHFSTKNFRAYLVIMVELLTFVLPNSCGSNVNKIQTTIKTLGRVKHHGKSSKR